MDSVFSEIITRYGILGIVIILLAGVGYLIWQDRKNNWGGKLTTLETNLGSKFDNTDRKIDLVEQKLDHRIDSVEKQMDEIGKKTYETSAEVARHHAKQQAIDIMHNGIAGKIAKSLRCSCSIIGCDHLFMGTFHNGTTDLRGIHFCKFDIVMDEFADPIHLHKKDTDYAPLYKDENVVAYGDLPYTLMKTGGIVFDITEKGGDLLDLSDTIYRRCVGRDVKQIGFAPLYDKDGSPIGFIGAVSFKKGTMHQERLKELSKSIENLV